MLKTPNKKLLPQTNHSRTQQKQNSQCRSHKKVFYKEKDEQQTIATISHCGDEYIGQFQNVEQSTVSINIYGHQYKLNCFDMKQVHDLLQWVDTIPHLCSHKIHTKLILLSNLSVHNPNLNQLLTSVCQEYSETQAKKLFIDSGK